MNKNIKKQLLEKEINGRKMRYCKIYDIWVNKEGTYAYREYNTPEWNNALQIYTRGDGSRYLNPKIPGVIEMDKAVAICFKPMPKDGNKYVLVHKDGNLSNCHVYNLEWKLLAKTSTTAGGNGKPVCGLTVKPDGRIFKKRKELPVITETGDRDTNRIVAVVPHVRYRRKNKWGETEEEHATIDDLMAGSQFVGGNRKAMKRPRVLHKDGNYMNFDSSNLEWAEESSPEYQDYLKKMRKDMDALTARLNPPRG